MNAKMMHDAYAKMEIFYFIEGLFEVNCKHCRGTWFFWKL